MYRLRKYKYIGLILSLFSLLIIPVQAEDMYYATEIPAQVKGNLVIEFVSNSYFRIIEGKLTTKPPFHYLDASSLSEDYPLPFAGMKVYYVDGKVTRIVDKDNIEVAGRLIKNGVGNIELNLKQLLVDEEGYIVENKNTSQTIKQTDQSTLLYGDTAMHEELDAMKYGEMMVVYQGSKKIVLHHADTTNDEYHYVYGVDL